MPVSLSTDADVVLLIHKYYVLSSKHNINH